MERLVSGRGESLTERQHHGLGLVTTVLAYRQFRYCGDLGKALNAYFFRIAGQAFDSSVSDGILLLRRDEGCEDAVASLLSKAHADFDDRASMH